MTNRKEFLGMCIAAAALAASPGFATAAGDPTRGAQVFRNCAACHSTAPGQNLTGPSLAGVWGRKAGSLESFHRYSDELKRSGVEWNERSLDAWLKDPATFIPGNAMNFQGIADARARSDLIAFLKAMSEGKTSAANTSGGMMMMGAPRFADLKQAEPRARITRIRYCGDTYTVTTAASKVIKFWEFNLRFKTDSTDHGPAKGQPVLVNQGMGVDRAQLVFSDPGEISAFIKSECP